MLPLRKGGGRARQDIGGGGERNIENDSVKIEYEQLKHNHYQVKELRKYTHTHRLEYVCIGRHTHTHIGPVKGKLLREQSVRSCTQRGSHGLIGLIEQDTVCMQSPLMRPQYCSCFLNSLCMCVVDTNECATVCFW